MDVALSPRPDLCSSSWRAAAPSSLARPSSSFSPANSSQRLPSPSNLHGRGRPCSNHGAQIFLALSHGVLPFSPSAPASSTPPAPCPSRNSSQRPLFLLPSSHGCQQVHLPWRWPLSHGRAPATSMDAPSFLLRASAGSPCSGSSHGAMIFCAAMPVQKQQPRTPSASRARSICAVPTRTVAMVFETATCRVVDLRRACESAKKILAGCCRGVSRDA
uniref:Uncharacterized protein n=1 Tax=Zea mays TaxID=4577 RepID=B4FA04_MAIZE|nr:unknown [Zea mays]|eukprot:NP_001130644.1 uncharacterized protein LOC100191745 [Zea mays]